MRSRSRWVLALGVPVVVSAGALFLYHHPVGSFPYPACPWYALTGTFCPGCGSTRSFSALVSGDLLLAFRQNLLVAPALLYLSWVYLRLLASLRPLLTARLPVRLGAPLLAQPRPHPRLVLSVLVVVLAWWVLRNVPSLSFLAPLPV